VSEMNEESKRVEHWLTQGRPRAVRTRGVVRTRGAIASAPSVTIKRLQQVAELQEQLREIVFAVPWVVVINGNVGAFAEQVCLQAKAAREDAKFWVVGSEQEMLERSALAALAPLCLNPQNAEDVRFRENLVADLVIIPAAPRASQGERVRRWLSQARCVLVEEPADSLIEELEMPQSAVGRTAEIWLIKAGR
jgi:hypothetical protein